MMTYTKGVLTGIALTVFYILMQHPADEIKEMERRIDAYRLCMESAKTTRCKMTTEDFIDYYDLKHRLLQKQ